MNYRSNAIYVLLTSTRLSIFLLVFLALACAAATFIENDFGSAAARAAVYNSAWFTFTLFLLALTLLGNMTKFNMWQKDKMPVFIFHSSFIIIMLGAFITRHYGYEGLMYIREGESADAFLTSDSYIKISSSGLRDSFPILLSPIGSHSRSFSANLGGGAPVEIKTKAFYPNAAEAIVPDPNGKAFISIVVTTGAEAPMLVELFEDEYVDLGVTLLGFGSAFNFKEPSIVISRDAADLSVKAHSDLIRTDIDTQETSSIRAHTPHPFDSGAEYSTIDGVKLTLRGNLAGAVKRVVPAQGKTGMSAVIADISHKGETAEVALLGGSPNEGRVAEVEIGERKFNISYGAMAVELPFALKLNKFILKRYPGSSSPSSYESQVFIQDNGAEREERIYMNHILKYKGFRFYQHSYDRDEKGTVLSVANDPGTWATYLGYTLLSIGFFAAFFSPKSRFREIVAQMEKNRARQRLLPI
ncbi:MAG: cytochrome c biogenesis protein ResB [Helicobacteraceae bacterium]|jgi:hypothetical protein|nr:cytochrome c biogenesis protein ResB [Helicobacteraceae bacterium]